MHVLPIIVCLATPVYGDPCAFFHDGTATCDLACISQRGVVPQVCLQATNGTACALSGQDCRLVHMPIYVTIQALTMVCIALKG